MLAVISLLTVVSLSLLITRIAAIALTHTGLAEQSARFQARSAFTGAGFTTQESERVVSHPVRRRIMLTLMLLGNAGLVTAVSSLMLSFVGNEEDGMSPWQRAALLFSGLAVLFLIARSRLVDRWLSRVVDRALHRFTDLDTRDYAAVMRLSGDYQLVELQIDSDCWMRDQRLADLKLRSEGIVVLGVQRPDGTWIGVPDGDTEMREGSVATVYGRADAIARLDQRSRDAEGASEHQEACEEQDQVQQEEREADEACAEEEAADRVETPA